jgi:hypothetical protein
MVFTFHNVFENGQLSLTTDGTPLNTLACSHTSLGVQASRSVVIEYLDRKRGDYITWYNTTDPLHAFPYRFYNHHYCDTLIGLTDAERQFNCIIMDVLHPRVLSHFQSIERHLESFSLIIVDFFPKTMGVIK